MTRLHLFGDEDDEAKPDTPAANLPSFKKMCEFAAEQPAVAELMAKERYEAAVQSFSNAPPVQEQTDASWVLKLQAHPKTGKPLSTVQNVQVILENDPGLKGRIYHDEMSGRPMAVSPLPWEPVGLSCGVRQWKDADDSGLRGYMESVHQITGEKKIGDGFAVYALNHRVHKLRDYLAAQVSNLIPG